MKKILVLGAGLVTKPLVRYLLDSSDVELIVASRTVSKAEALIDGHPRGQAIPLDVKDEKKLEELIKDAEIVISLLPYTHHVMVAKFCLTHITNLITTSYVSEEMKKLDEKAKKKGLLFLNEIGLDPGIDHMSAMKIIDDVKKRGGKIISFESVCGGLPAPEANDNPFGYKFSWSPRGVLLAGRNNGKYLKDKKIVEVDGSELFKNNWIKEVDTLGELEVYPNRDSMIYEELYGLSNAKTIFRGTFRNLGWCDTLYHIAQLGWLDDTINKDLKGLTYYKLTAKLIDCQNLPLLKEIVAQKIEHPIESVVMSNLEWLGLFSNEVADTSTPSYIDILTARMLEKMSYKEGERDMIVLQHDFIAKFKNDRKEHIISLMIDYGIPNGDSAMARTVSLPAAIAAKLLIENKINLTGVHIPNSPEIYLPVLEELERLNIKMNDTIEKI